MDATHRAHPRRHVRRLQYVRHCGAGISTGSGDHLDLWGYGDRNEIAHSERYASTQPANPTNPVHDLDRHFAYDPIGNRTSSKIGDSGDPNVPSSSYAANNVNQYTMIGFVSPVLQQKSTFDADGNLTQTLVAVDVADDQRLS